MLDEITSRRTLYAAFERVRENAGCRGADGVTVQQFGERLEWELDSIQDRLLRRCYHPFPLLRFEVPKSGNRVRSLSVPTVRNRVLQTAVYLTTRDLFDAELEEHSYAFRQGRSVKDAVRRIDELRRQGFHWVVDADIEAFFDNIDHERLLARLRRLPLDPYVLTLFERWIRAEVYDGETIDRLARGIPQGSVVYLPFDRPKRERIVPYLPPPLDLLTYLELRSWPPST